MSMPKTSTTTKTLGFPNACPECGSRNTLSVSLADVMAISCDECSFHFNEAELLQYIDDLKGILAWLRTAPERGEEARGGNGES